MLERIDFTNSLTQDDMMTGSPPLRHYAGQVLAVLNIDCIFSTKAGLRWVRVHFSGSQAIKMRFPTLAVFSLFFVFEILWSQHVGISKVKKKNERLSCTGLKNQWRLLLFTLFRLPHFRLRAGLLSSISNQKMAKFLLAITLFGTKFYVRRSSTKMMANFLIGHST